MFRSPLILQKGAMADKQFCALVLSSLCRVLSSPFALPIFDQRTHYLNASHRGPEIIE